MRNEGDSPIKDDSQNESIISPLMSEAAAELSSRLRIVGDRAEVLDSMTASTTGTRIGATPKNEEMTATIMVRSKASEQEMNDTLAKIADHEIKPLSAKEFADKFGADPQSMQRVLGFAKDNGLKVTQSDLDSGTVSLKGAVGDFSNAFKVQFSDYKADDGHIARERSGVFSVPKQIGSDIQGVLGLDTRAGAHSLIKMQDTENAAVAPQFKTQFLPNQIADAYNFPKESMGAGQSVAIIELGGGLDLKDNAQYYTENKLKVPDIQLVSVDGVGTAPTGTKEKSGADSEVALDTQVIGAVAPDAHQQIIFTTNDDGMQGFVDGITRATFAREGEQQNSVISISWGGRETGADAQTLKSMDIAFKKAALKGISVFVASGDSGAGDENRVHPENDGKLVADFPASDPWVTATGGTRLEIDSKGKAHESVWNSHNGLIGGGGGVSQVFEKPDYQKALDMPVNSNPMDPKGISGRGEPDISGDADPGTGYRIRVDGREAVTGGTSAVAPLYAALMMRVNGALGKPVGFVNPFLYKHGNDGIFNDVTDGNNNGFKAGPGWDAASGWGSINGTAFLNQLRKDSISGTNSVIA